MRLWGDESLKKEEYRLKALTILDFYGKKGLASTIIDFLAGFIALIKNDRVDMRELNYKLFSHRKNYEFINLLIEEGIVQRVADGMYALTPEAKEILDKVSPTIQKFVSTLESSYISKTKKQDIKNNNEREESVR